jgi:hypothetical protein
MATVTQRLAFLISANADQAIRAFEKTSGSASKEMAKAEKSLEKVGASLTKFGAGGLAGAGLIGKQLFTAGQSASDLSESVNKTNVIFGQTSKEIQNFASTAADSLGLSKRAALDAASTFATFGKAAGLSGQELNTFSTDLVTLSADFASFFNTSPEDAITAIGAALRGESEPIRRYGILLNDAVLKQEAMTLGIYNGNGALTNQQKVLAAQAAIMKQSADAQGDFARTSDGLANSQRRLQASIENAKAELGEAALPVMQQATDILLSVAQGFTKVNDATGGAVSKLVTFGTVGLGVVSTLSLMAGQAIKMRERFVQVGDDGERSLTKLGSAAKYASIGLGAIALSEATFAVLNEITDSSQKLEQGLQDLNVALSGVDGTTMLNSFRDLVKRQDETFKFSKIISDFGKEITIVGGEASRNIEDIDAAFQQLLKQSGPKAAQGLIDAWKAQNLTLDQASGQYKDNTMLIERYQSRIDSLVGSQKALNEINNEGVTSLEELKSTYKSYSEALLKVEDRQQQLDIDKMIAATRERQAEADKRATKAAQKFREEVETLASALEQKFATALSKAEENAKNANEAYKNYRDSIAGSVSGVVNFSNAQATAEENAKTLADALTKQSEAQTKLNQAFTDGDAEKIAEARRDLADATTEVANAEKLPRTFDQALKGQVQSATDFKTQLQTLLDLGADQALIDQLTAAGADAGGAIIKGILASADPKARVDELDATLASIGQLATTIGVSAADQFYGAGVKLANDLLSGVEETIGKIDVENIKTGKNPKRRLKQKTKQVDQSFATLFGLAGLAIPDMADGGIVKASPGGTLVRVAEAGRDEAILPLPSAMQPPSIINITVNAGMGADGTQVGKQIVDELVAYQRRVGALPIKVSG